MKSLDLFINISVIFVAGHPHMFERKKLHHRDWGGAPVITVMSFSFEHVRDSIRLFWLMNGPAFGVPMRGFQCTMERGHTIHVCAARLRRAARRM